MGTNKKQSIAAKVVISALVAFAVLAGGTVAFFRWIMPLGTINTETLYTVAIRIFPVLIGLILFSMGAIMAAPTTEEDKRDSFDQVKADAVTEPFDRLPDGNVPPYAESATDLFDEIEAAGIYQQQTGKTSIGASYAPVIEPFKAPEPARWPFGKPLDDEPEEPIWQDEYSTQPKPIETPFIISEEIPETQAPVIPWTTPSAEAIAIDSGASRAILFSDYPYEITKGTVIAELLEPLPETPMMFDERIAEYEKSIEDSFGNRINVEIESAVQGDYDLTLALVSFPKISEDDHSNVDSEITQLVLDKLGDSSFFYVIEEHKIAVIMPFYGFDQAKRFFAWLLDVVSKKNKDSYLFIGYSSLRNRKVDRETLYNETELANVLASEQGGFSVIGFDVEAIGLSQAN
ncbi:MAG: hypothetical protein WCY44_03120 [Sphaerochaetaceae bacterium]